MKFVVFIRLEIYIHICKEIILLFSEPTIASSLVFLFCFHSVF